MFAGALAAARALGAVPFYFDSQNRRVTFVDNLDSAAIRPIETIETFLLLNDEELKLSKTNEIPDLSSDRRLLIETLWKCHNKMDKCYAQLREFRKGIMPFRVEGCGFVFELDKNNSATVVGRGLDLRFENWPSFAQCLCGGWFEEYIYLQFKPYQDAGLIKDLRINVELQFSRKDTERYNRISDLYNELDIVFTDGHSLYIVECKAGSVTQEQIMKLQNIVRFYGGTEGCGIIACCIPPNAESIQKKIKDARLTLCCGETLSTQVRALMEGITKRAKTNEDCI